MELDNLTTFDAMGDKYLSILQEANAKYLSVRQQYEMLIARLRGDKVAWKDRQAFLINQAKKCGLHRMTIYAGPGKMRHRNFQELKKDKPRWFIMILKFIEYADKRYSDYGVEIERKVKPTIPKANPLATGRDFGKKAEVKPAGPTNKTGVSNVPSVVAEAKEAKSSTAHLEEANNSTITSPVETKLSVIEIQQIILQNLSVLGKIASAKGAKEEFNALMAKLGATDEIIS